MLTEPAAQQSASPGPTITDRRLADQIPLGRIYEEVVREWRLPTSLAASLDYYPNSKYGPAWPTDG